jgi:hypothetical protein
MKSEHVCRSRVTDAWTRRQRRATDRWKGLFHGERVLAAVPRNAVAVPRTPDSTTVPLPLVMVTRSDVSDATAALLAPYIGNIGGLLGGGFVRGGLGIGRPALRAGRSPPARSTLPLRSRPERPGLRDPEPS